ncbi:MAG: hypothetical protein M0P07_05430 [Candidatus Methanomethylophilaceae archaeon]|nr:hypothetical protein [Candidatus Methanomethylophilaceae archaeon]
MPAIEEMITDSLAKPNASCNPAECKGDCKFCEGNSIRRSYASRER